MRELRADSAARGHVSAQPARVPCRIGWPV